MNTLSDYRYILEIRDPEMKYVLHQEPLHSLSKLVDHFTFEAQCRRLVNGDVEGVQAVVSPVWLPDKDGPYVKGLSVTLDPGNGSEVPAREYGITPFSSQAHAAAQGLLAQGMLKPNERFYYLISAFPNPQAPVQPNPENGGGKFRTSVKKARLHFVEQSAPGLEAERSVNSTDLFDVNVPHHVIDDILGQVSRSHEKEQAGFLIGYLGRDPRTGRLHSMVTAQVQATEGVEATCTSFRFSDQSFLAARRFLDLRGRPEETILGWQHSHTWCVKCQKRDQCEANTVFWSSDDQRVQESAFPQPFQIGLVVGQDHTKDQDSYSFKMYGWTDACICERSFNVIEEGGCHAK